MARQVTLVDFRLHVALHVYYRVIRCANAHAKYSFYDVIVSNTVN